MSPISKLAALIGLSLSTFGTLWSSAVQAMAPEREARLPNFPSLIAQEFPGEGPTEFPIDGFPETPFPETPLPEIPRDPVPTDNPPVNEPPTIPGCIADCTLSLPPSDSPEAQTPALNSPNIRTPLLVIEPSARSGIFQDLAQIDSRYSNEFTTYLGLDGTVFNPPAIPQIQENLRLVAQETGIKPAIVYVAFVPPTAEHLNRPNITRGETLKQRLRKSFETQPFDDQAAETRPFETETVRSPQRSYSSDDLLELIVVTSDGPPIRRTLSVTHAQVQRVSSQLRSQVTNRSRINSQTYLNAAQQLYGWLITPLEAELAQREIGNLAFVMSAGLRALPLSALHNGEQFLIERYSVGLMPSVNLTDLRYVDVRDSEVLAMGASNFVDQPELPAVPIELQTIADQIWPGDFLINETFTPEILVSSRQQKSYGIVHLATHGEFKPGKVDNSYIQFWDQRLGLDQVRNLRLNSPPVELMVLSACRTALGSDEAELGFAGLALQAGVKTALASLWKVDDVGTAGLMTQFYSSLQEEPIKAEALRQTQLAMLRGDIQIKGNTLIWSGGEIELPPELANVSPEVFSHPFFWSAFTVIGSPW